MGERDNIGVLFRLQRTTEPPIEIQQIWNATQLGEFILKVKGKFKMFSKGDLMIIDMSYANFEQTLKKVFL